MKIFLAGIMQGSHRAAILHEQDYRARLKQMLASHLPEAEVYDPLEDHGDSINYDDQTGREVFFRHNRMCREVDVVLAFEDSLPGVTLTATARTTGRTGVEMEAMTAVSVAALAVYDMIKGIDRRARISDVRLIEKHGGRSGDLVLEPGP